MIIMVGRQNVMDGLVHGVEFVLSGDISRFYLSFHYTETL